jgi:TatD DNase family protein
MSVSLVDSHCHLDRLDHKKAGTTLDSVMDSARDHGVDHMLCVSIDLRHLPHMLEIIEPYPQVFATAGVHPNDRKGPEPTEQDLLRLAEHPRIVAIGETGLDYFRCEGDLEWQRERFRVHIRAAKQAGLPMVIHMREATEDTLRIMAEEGAGEVGGVMHCFAEDWPVAQRAMDLGFLISFSGIVTFNSAKALREVAAKVPEDRFLVETDSPYLAPVPHRGKPNQPAYVRHVAEKVAELRGVPLEQVAADSTRNFFALFPRARSAINPATK